MKELLAIQCELKAPKNQRNKFGNFDYRSCEDILEALKPHLAKNKCVLLLGDEVVQKGDRYYVEATARIINSEGAEMSVKACAREAEDKKGMDASQITGSTSSYARKYALSGLFAIDDTKDADGSDNKPEKTDKEIISDKRKKLTEMMMSDDRLRNNILNRYDLPEIGLMAESQIVETYDAMELKGLVR